MFLIAAIFIMCIANAIRCARWSILTESYEKTDSRVMLRALSYGYIINFFVPFKLGDLFRVFYSGKRMKNGIGFSMATIVIERCLDIIIVGLIFGGFYFLRFRGGSEFIVYIVLATVIVLGIVLSVILRKPLKRLISAFAGLFNERIEGHLLQFFWALICGFKDIAGKISKLRLIAYTIGMWGLYIASYWCFSEFLSNTEWKSVFISLFASTSLFTSQLFLSKDVIWYGIFLLSPSVIILIISLFWRSRTSDEREYLNLIPHVNSSDRLAFLEIYFSADQNAFIKNYLEINRKVQVLRDCSAGSNATTILCRSLDDVFYRKYAFGEDGKRLYMQIQWLRDNSSALPLPEVLKCESSEKYCFYDMPFRSDAVGMFDYVHSAPREDSWEMIRAVLEKLESCLYAPTARPADPDAIERYVAEKVEKNIARITEAKFIKPLMEYDHILINGRKYRNLPYYLQFLTADHLREIFREDTCSVIHGDLTIENIICLRNSGGKDDFYIIDPNIGNVHESPNLDYAKLLQSIHGSYEFFMAAEDPVVEENRLTFRLIRSDAYSSILRRFDEYMTSEFSYERVRSIYYHEVIHWLRLMPYKISKNGQRAVLFYAGLLLVLNDVTERFEHEKAAGTV